MSRSLWVGLFVLAVEGVASAQATPSPPEERQATPSPPEESTQTTRDETLDQAARLTFQAAREAFGAGDYERALERFEQAYNLSPRPVLLYNIGVTLDRLRRDEDAVARFTEYLERIPDAPDRVEVEARIRVLQRAIDERRAAEAAREAEEERRAREREEAERRAREAAAQQAAVAPTPPPSEAESAGLHPAIALAVGGAALAAGGLLVWSGLDATSRNDDYEAYAGQPDAVRGEGERLYDRVRSAETRTNALIGVASGIAASAVVLAIFTDWSFGGGDEGPDANTTVGAAPTRSGFQLGVWHRF